MSNQNQAHAPPADVPAEAPPPGPGAKGNRKPKPKPPEWLDAQEVRLTERELRALLRAGYLKRIQRYLKRTSFADWAMRLVGLMHLLVFLGKEAVEAFDKIAATMDASHSSVVLKAFAQLMGF